MACIVQGQILLEHSQKLVTLETGKNVERKGPRIKIVVHGLLVLVPELTNFSGKGHFGVGKALLLVMHHLHLLLV